MTPDQKLTKAVFHLARRRDSRYAQVIAAAREATTAEEREASAAEVQALETAAFETARLVIDEVRYLGWTPPEAQPPTPPPGPKPRGVLKPGMHLAHRHEAHTLTGLESA